MSLFVKVLQSRMSLKSLTEACQHNSLTTFAIDAGS